MKKLLLISLLINSFAFAQVGIGTITPTGALDVSSSLPSPSTQKAGFVPPIVALSATNSTLTTTAGVSVINPDTNGVPVTGTIVYNTNTSAVGANQVFPGYYFYNGTFWTLMATGSNSDWSTTGNASTTPSTNFIGTSDSQALVVKTANTERMRINANGRIGINLITAPEAQLHIIGNNAPITGNLGTSLTRNNNSAGTAIIGIGQNGVDNALLLGSGGSFSGTTTGSFHYTNSNGVVQSIAMSDGFGANWLAGYWSGAAYRKIIGNGNVSTIVRDLNEELVVMNCPETPESMYLDYGIGKLQNGKVHITIDPILSKNIIVNENHPLKVFIQLEGDCNGVFVTNKSSTGFDVIELNSGTSDVQFSFSIAATMGDQKVVANDGTVRTSKYDKRWEKAPEFPNSILTRK